MAKILIHARATDKRHTSYRNWPMRNWKILVNAFYASEFHCIGSKDGAAHVDGTIDSRGIEICDLIQLMKSADLLLSPSSGPVHLASLCGLPHIVWTDDKYQGTIGGTNRDRYETAWNPFGTKCYVIDKHGWQPNAHVVIDKAKRVLSGERCRKRVKISKPDYPAIAMVTYERPEVFRATITSLEKTGINAQSVYVFDDCSQDMKKQSYLRHAKKKLYNVYVNSRRLNVFWNTRLAIDCLYNFTANKVLIYSQDDVKFSPYWYRDTLSIIEEMHSAGLDWGILILWNLKWDIEENYRVLPSGHGGGVCWAINREMWKQYREDNNIYEAPAKNRIADYQLCHWCRTNRRRDWAVCHVGKSLVQHTGAVSTITEGRDMSKFKGINYVGE